MYSGPIKFAGFLDHQQHWKEVIDVLRFLHSDIYRRKIASKTTAIVRVWLGVPNHTQTCFNLSGDNFGWSGTCIATLKIV